MAVEQEIDFIKGEIRSIRKDVDTIQARQVSYIEAHHLLEKEMVELKSDIKYIKAGQDNLHSSINRVLFTIAAGFIAAGVTWIVNGGLS